MKKMVAVVALAEREASHASKPVKRVATAPKPAAGGAEAGGRRANTAFLLAAESAQRWPAGGGDACSADAGGADAGGANAASTGCLTVTDTARNWNL